MLRAESSLAESVPDADQAASERGADGTSSDAAAVTLSPALVEQVAARVYELLRRDLLVQRERRGGAQSRR